MYARWQNSSINEKENDMNDCEKIAIHYSDKCDKLQAKIKLLMKALHYECPEKYPDNCEICKGTSSGVRGNENIVNGIVMCDYCSVKHDTE